jgi:hypothetical protein
VQQEATKIEDKKGIKDMISREALPNGRLAGPQKILEKIMQAEEKVRNKTVTDQQINLST